MDVKAVVRRMKAAASLETDSQLAQRLGVPFGTLNSWKKRNSLPIDFIERFGDDFDCSLAWLILGREAQDTFTHLEIIEPRAFRLCVRMALGTSGLQDDEIRKIIENTHFYKRLILAQISRLSLDGRITSSEAFEQIESAFEEAASASENGIPAGDGPLWTKKVFDLP